MTNDTLSHEPGGSTKICSQCLTEKPLTEFLSRSGKRAGAARRRGTCRDCRRQSRGPEASADDGLPADRAEAAVGTAAEAASAESEPARRKRKRRRGKRKRKGGAAAGGTVAVAAAATGKKLPAPLVAAVPAKVLARPQPKTAAPAPSAPSADAFGLKPTKLGFIRMRGKTDNGRRWYQEVEPELAFTLVRENAAVVVNRHTIRRLYSNKEFRRLILTRDNYTCHFCGQYGDTIDHLLPRAKGGHTTPVNCVCACNECNQSKADRDLLEFMGFQD